MRKGIDDASNNLSKVVINKPESIDTGYLDSVSNIFTNLKSRTHELSNESEHTVQDIYAVFQTGDTIALSSGTVTGISGQDSVSTVNPFKDDVLLDYYRSKKYGDRFLKFDQALGKTYQEVDEILFGTRSDPERAASYMIRQVYDYLISILAPDDVVRESRFFSLKSEPGKENTVSRMERINYAIATHVKNEKQADQLKVLSNHILEFYDVLQKAHTRGSINKQDAINSIRTVKNYLEVWADAIGI
ncbi:MAG: hypothetical protein FVQ80_13185 [Planctomycetes bacterium]|nr:hypothetical protein [Planctomycetota bacterium]